MYALDTLSWTLLESRFLGLKRFFEARTAFPEPAIDVLVAVTQG